MRRSAGEPSFVAPASCVIPWVGTNTSDVTWLGRPAAESQRAHAHRAGLSEGASSDVITITPGGVATSAALRAFVQATDGVPGDVVGSLAAPYDRLSSAPCFGPPARLVRLRGGGALSPDRLAEASPIAVGVRGRSVPVPLLDRPGGRSENLDLSAAVLLSLSEWPGVIWANLLGLYPALFGALLEPWPSAPIRLALAAMRARSVQPEALGRALIRRGRASSVHPSATVEGSWLMEGARVDAGAVVRHAVLGPGAVVEAQGLVIGSVLGPGARVQRRGFATYSVLDAGAIVGGELQLGMIGPAAQLKIGAILLDQHLAQSVRVRTGSGLHEAPLGLLGAALGAGAMVGAGVCVAAGRCVPPGVQIAASEGQVLQQVSSEQPGRYRVRAGGLSPC